MKSNQKLYVVTRSDLRPGQQAVQGMHALTDFVFKHPDQASEWHSISNYLCFLTVSTEFELEALLDAADYAGVRCAGFWEPDLNDGLTAVCLEATDTATSLVKGLGLALRLVPWQNDNAEGSNSSIRGFNSHQDRQMKPREERRKRILGVPHSTAIRTLRKKLLFSCVVRLHENVCYRCGEPIVDIDDFTLDHKIPWEREDLGIGHSLHLFTDTNNVAYSHSKCNSLASSKTTDAYLARGKKK